KNGITKIDAGSGVAYSWRSGSLSGRAEQQKLMDAAGFDGQVSKYLAEIKHRCSGSFAARPGLNNEKNGVSVSAYETACVSAAASTATAVLFYSQNGLFTSITHEGSLDDLDAGMDIRDKLADKLLRFKIAPSPGVATHVAPPWQCSVSGKDSMTSEARRVGPAGLDKFPGRY